MEKYLVVIAGPTAIGKTDLSLSIAKKYHTDILSCDSRQFYKEMNIGTAVPTIDKLAQVKHHFIQNLSIKQNYSVGKFEIDALNKIEELHQTKDVIVMVGGSGLYLDTVCSGLNDFPDVSKKLRDELNSRFNNEGIEPLISQLNKLDPEYHEEVDKTNPHRVIRALEICISSGKSFSSFRKQQKKKRNFKSIKLILSRDREDLYNRINQRVDMMMAKGLLEEAKNVYEYRAYNALQTVGYKELFRYFDGEWDLETAISQIKKNTRRYAKRQMTWFRRDPETVFFHPSEEFEILKYLDENIKG